MAPTVTNPVTVLNLTSSTPITATSNNAAFVSIISGGTLIIPAGVDTFNIGDIQIAGVDYTQIGSYSGTVATLNITSVIAQGGSGTSINKTGNGLLQLSGQNTFDSGVNVMAGGLIIGASSTPITVGSAVTSGPLGLGPLTVNGLSSQQGVVGNTNMITGLANTQYLYAGEAISGTNIPAGSTVVSYGYDFSIGQYYVTISAPATGAKSNTTPSSLVFGTQTTLLSSGSNTVNNAVTALGDLERHDDPGGHRQSECHGGQSGNDGDLRRLRERLLSDQPDETGAGNPGHYGNLQCL
jgi:autotransporter-associated beta strand protein